MPVPPKLKNPPFGMKNMGDYTWKKDDVPLRENCDLEDPRQMFLWMFTGLPGVNGAPLPLPAAFWMMVSEHLHECGARLSGDPIKKYRRPTGREPNAFTAPGTWVALDVADPPANPARKFWESLDWQQKAELLKAANYEESGGDDAA